MKKTQGDSSKKKAEKVVKSLKAKAVKEVAFKPYDHLKIEKKWQKAWKASGINKTKEVKGRPKAYILDMFPYPSGQGLHVGHPKGYIATDIYARFKAMSGFNVLHPMGWDAFGLPAEEFAIKNKIHPSIATKKNVARYKEQLSILGFNYDWSREVNTTDPEYYKWTQWAFLQMHKKGLTFESHEPINWCPSCKTGLSNEDLEDGKCERCGSVVEKKPIRQWVIRITDYADRLLNDLEGLNWPESIKESQRNWIGRSEGSEISFKIEGSEETVDVFTTRADTLFGVTYVVLAPEHPLVEKLMPSIKNEAEVRSFINSVKQKSDIERTAEGKEKHGISLKGIHAINPINGESIKVWIADYVLAGYGTGAVMAVPAHDERDFQFAKKYNLPTRNVVAHYFVDPDAPFKEGVPVVERQTVNVILRDRENGKVLCLDWKELKSHFFVIGGIENGESAVDAGKRELLEETGYKNVRFVKELGKSRGVFYAAHKNENRIANGTVLLFDLVNHDRDTVSDAEKKKHSAVWIDESEIAPLLHVSHKHKWEWAANEQPFTEKGSLIASGKYDGMASDDALQKITAAAGGRMVTKYKLRDWVFSRQRYWGEPIPLIHCASCGVVPVPEKELPLKLPNVKSYEPTGTGESPLAAIDKWVNVKCPTCKGPAKRETNTMPQWAGSCWYYLRYIDPKNKKALVDPKKEKYWQPVDMYVGGAEHATRHLIYARFWHKFLYDIGVVSTTEPFMQLKNQGLIAGPDGRKMSKRYGNVVNPDDMVKLYGADTLRVYEMFMGPFDAGIAWSTDNMIGSRRFIERVWKLKDKAAKRVKVENKELESVLHKTIKKVTEDIENFSLNTAVSSMMILVNAMEKEIQTSEVVPLGAYETLLKLLAPFAPHVADELWAALGHKKSIHLESWPIFDSKKLESGVFRIVVQINSKVRAVFETTSEDESEVLAKALKLPEIVQKLEGKVPSKTFYVKGKLINLIIS